jgi:hypothetical protein
MTPRFRTALIAFAFLAPTTPSATAQSPAAAATAQSPAPAAAAPSAANPSPELVTRLTNKLAITPEQATGGAGAIFGLAKTRLSPEDFGKVSAAVPGMDGLLKAAPKAEETPVTSAMGAIGAAVPGGAGGVASTATGLASLAGPFKSLGLSPDMAVQMIPLMTKFVSNRGGTDVGNILAGALK